MRAHIICREAENGNRILARLGRGLARATGWTISDYPDPTVEINYWLPYLEIFSHRGPWPKTKHAAWFTHHDTMQRGKGDLWVQAAERVDLRLTSARIYAADLRQYGPVGMVKPPLNRSKFVIDGKYTAADMPVVGVSGWVYPGGRKGEGLVDRLLATPLGKRLHMVASGKGWPVSTRHYDWNSLEKFYQRLDIYLCTSLVEGVPYPPLEALACGKRVVIPSGVGLLDDLPQMAGIERYRAGDFDSMCTAIEAAWQADPDPKELRAAVADYTAARWADDHIEAIERLFFPARKAGFLPSWEANGCAGVYYVAFGDPSRQMAKKAVRSFKRQMGAVPVAVVSDRVLKAGEDVFIHQPDQDIGGRIAKINIDRLAPTEWQYILYLDADTEIVADIGFLFQVLADGWELVICKNPGKYHLLNEMIRPDNKPEADLTFDALGTNQALQLNGGVFAYRRNERTAHFFELWLEEWNRYGGRDQAALHRALWRQPLQVYVLGNEWNTIIRYDNQGGYAYDTPEITAGILHYPTTARRWVGRIEGRLDGERAWAAVKK